MERTVNVRRCRQTGIYIVNPFGMFRGSGGHVGINPYRALPADADSSDLGEMVMSLLYVTGSFSVTIAEASEFLKRSADKETVRIRKQFGLDSPSISTHQLAQRFASLSVSLRKGEKSWKIQKYENDPRSNASSKNKVPYYRISLGSRSEGLGRTIQDLLMQPDD